jgi:hypothetical protein
MSGCDPETWVIMATMAISFQMVERVTITARPTGLETLWDAVLTMSGVSSFTKNGIHLGNTTTLLFYIIY